MHKILKVTSLKHAQAGKNWTCQLNDDINDKLIVLGIYKGYILNTSLNIGCMKCK